MTRVNFAVARHARGWVIKHNGEILGYAHTEREARSIAPGLVAAVALSAARAARGRAIKYNGGLLGYAHIDGKPAESP